MRSDIAILSELGEPVLLVEVKNKTGTSKDWAAKLRRNLVAHGLLPKARFFLVATPDHFYLWKDTGNGADELEPDYDIDPRAITKPLFKPEEQIGPAEFETKVASWVACADIEFGGRPRQWRRWRFVIEVRSERGASRR